MHKERVWRIYIHILGLTKLSSPENLASRVDGTTGQVSEVDGAGPSPSALTLSSTVMCHHHTWRRLKTEYFCNKKTRNKKCKRPADAVHVARVTDLGFWGLFGDMRGKRSVREELHMMMMKLDNVVGNWKISEGNYEQKGRGGRRQQLFKVNVQYCLCVFVLFG